MARTRLLTSLGSRAIAWRLPACAAFSTAAPQERWWQVESVPGIKGLRLTLVQKSQHGDLSDRSAKLHVTSGLSAVHEAVQSCLSSSARNITFYVGDFRIQPDQYDASALLFAQGKRHDSEFNSGVLPMPPEDLPEGYVLSSLAIEVEDELSRVYVHSNDAQPLEFSEAHSQHIHNVRMGGGGTLNKAMVSMGAVAMLGLCWLKYNENPEDATAEGGKGSGRPVRTGTSRDRTKEVDT